LIFFTLPLSMPLLLPYCLHISPRRAILALMLRHSIITPIFFFFAFRFLSFHCFIAADFHIDAAHISSPPLMLFARFSMTPPAMPWLSRFAPRQPFFHFRTPPPCRCAPACHERHFTSAIAVLHFADTPLPIIAATPLRSRRARTARAHVERYAPLHARAARYAVEAT
jgi:hypothetical protein